MTTGTGATIEALVLEREEALRRDMAVFLCRVCRLSVIEGADTDALDPWRGALAGLRLAVVGSGSDGREGIEAVRRLRAEGTGAFVLYINRQLQPEEGADAFAAGADDVMRTPFSLREFGLRLRARLGTGPGDGAAVPLVMLDGDNRLLAAGSQATVQLTRAEAEVMAVILRHSGSLVTRDDLSRAIDKCDWVYGDRKFDVHITKIRKKLKAAFGARYQLRAVRSAGYAFVENTAGADVPVG